MSPRQIVRNTFIALLLLVPLGFAMAAGRDETQNGEDVDRAFLTAMVAHHDAASRRAGGRWTS